MVRAIDVGGGLLIGALALQEAPPPVGGTATAPVVAPVPVFADERPPVTGIRPPVDRADPRRKARLAKQKEALDRQLAAMERFGHEPEWVEATRALHTAWVAEHAEITYVEVGDWVFTETLMRNIATSKIPGPLEKREPNEDGTLPALLDLVDLDRQFAEQGIDFLVVTVPSKLSVYPEAVLPELPLEGFAGFGSNLTRLLVEATREGVEALSLTAPFVAARGAIGGSDDLLFLKSDPHWTVRGSTLGAEKVAERIAQYPWFKPGPWPAGRHYHVEERGIPYVAGSDLASKGARDETMRGHVLVANSRPFNVVDAKSPILVFGDSYVRVHNEWAADFCSQLCRFTGWKIDAVFATSGGQTQVRQKLARRERGQWKGKKLAIWLLPEQLRLKAVKVDPIELFPIDEGER
ncbi:MAG: hypothetical protein JNL90_09650 [Planctomycetes bacterium]|nr:hypothetical protein [Planctomycetota bacterium]